MHPVDYSMPSGDGAVKVSKRVKIILSHSIPLIKASWNMSHEAHTDQLKNQPEPKLLEANLIQGVGMGSSNTAVSFTAKAWILGADC